MRRKEKEFETHDDENILTESFLKDLLILRISRNEEEREVENKT
jgi:hypothetical protein